jgi:catechol 2,3-dioxygenase-like lactoylglutathione lyase family enzyme
MAIHRRQIYQRSRAQEEAERTVPMKIFRVTIEVSNLDQASAFYTKLLGDAGKRHPGARHYFHCGGVVLAVLDVSQGGMKPTPGPKSIYFATDDIRPVHERAEQLGALAPFSVHGMSAGEVVKRPWGEVSFYVTDPWGNELCFVEDGTLYT